MTTLTPTPILRELVVGHVDLDESASGIAPVRLPAALRPQVPAEPIHWVLSHTAGIRLRMRTTATRMRLTATFARHAGADAQLRPAILVAEVDGREVARPCVSEGPVDLGQPDGTITHRPGDRAVVEIALGPSGGRERLVELWLPHRSRTRMHELSADAPLEPAPLAPDRVRWVHHGSSISHGQQATAPTTSWAQQAARALGWELTNLGFAGNAMLDPFCARTIASLPADVITLKLGINVVNADAMRRRTFGPALHGFLDTIRDHHPRTPLVLISAIHSPGFERLPGPSVVDEDGVFSGQARDEPDSAGALDLRATRTLLSEVAAARADPHLSVWSGLDLLGPTDADLLPDGLHPDQTGHDRMAERFVRLARDGVLLAMSQPARRESDSDPLLP